MQNEIGCVRKSQRIFSTEIIHANFLWFLYLGPHKALVARLYSHQNDILY